MATALQVLPFDVIGAGIETIEVPSPAEFQLVSFSGLAQWWRADVGWSPTNGWLDRKGDKLLLPVRNAVPTASVDATFNNKMALHFGSGIAAGDLWDNGAGLWPVGRDFTIVYVGRTGSADGALVGTGEIVANSSSVKHLLTGKIEVRDNANTFVAATTQNFVPANGPHLGIVSYDRTARDLVIRANRGAGQGQNLDVLLAETSTELHVGAVGTSAGISLPLSGGAIAELMIFSVPLLSASYADTLSLLEGYLGGRYGIAAA